MDLPKSIIKQSRFIQCPCCNSYNLQIAWNNPNFESVKDWSNFMFGGRKFIDQIINCNNCNFRYIQTPTDGKKFYINSDYNIYSALVDMRLRYFLKIKVALNNRGIILTNQAHMLDIGAGEGDWLATWPEIQNRNATEIQPVLRKKIRQKGIYTKANLDFFENNRFDFISAFDFLEHIEDPNFLLKRVNDLLAKKGIVVIGVPDMQKWVARLLGTRYYLYCPMHYSYFTEKSLRMLLNKYFCQIEIFSSPTMYTSINGAIKWLTPKLQISWLNNVSLPIGYSASLIAIARKKL